MNLVLAFSTFIFSIDICRGQPPLEQYNVDKSQITVSGFSSGGAFSTQFHVVHSSSVKGACIFGGMPYNCFAYYGISGCGQTPELVDIDRLVQDTRDFANIDLIDPVSGINGDKIFLFFGPNDMTVQIGNGPAIREYYQNFASTDIREEYDIPAGHGYPTNDYGNDCETSSPPAINNCNYGGAFQCLNHVYDGNLTNPATAYTPNWDNLIEFDQLEFAGVGTSFDNLGWVYVPTACRDRTIACKLHVQFHGCSQGRAWQGTQYAGFTGYNSVAEMNNIIILHPNIDIPDHNASGCWDWYAIEDEDYQTRRGVMVSTIKAMIDRITG